MRKFTIYNLQFTIFVLLCYILHFTFYIHPVYAADSTPSADIKSKLEELQKEIASKAAKLKQEVNRKLQNKAFIGTVKTKSPTSLTLATKTGPKLVNLNQDTIYDIAPTVKGKYSFKNIEEEDFIASLGDIDETQVLTAKKVILLPIPKEEPRTYLWGQVITISDRLVTIKNRELKNIAVSVTNQTNTKKGGEEVSVGDLKVNDFVILVGSLNKNEIFVSRFLYIIPQGGILKPKKIATPSANLKPTPGATSSGKKKS